MSEDARASGVLIVKKLTNVLLSILDTHTAIFPYSSILTVLWNKKFKFSKEYSYL